MIISLSVYAGLLLMVVGLAAVIRPIRWVGLLTRRKGLGLGMAGLAFVVIGLTARTPEYRVARTNMLLDEFIPVWQFREVHTIDVDAPPERVFDAIKSVRADEILFFRTLTWIRRGGRPLPPGILNASPNESLIDVALNGGFIRLAEVPPRELVIGTVVLVPPGRHGRLTPEVFRRKLPPGFALAAMNFLVDQNRAGRTRVHTETRVYANSPAACRRFARYWRIIYPGSAIIRRMWLRAVKRRATTEPRKSQMRDPRSVALSFER
jgi:hypothetical protein